MIDDYSDKITRQAAASSRAWASLLLAAALTALLPQIAWAKSSTQDQSAEPGLSSERLERLSGAMQAYVDEGKLPGAVILVARHGNPVYLQAFGYRDREARAPMSTDVIFRVASQSKALVTVGVMILQEQGRLLINDPLSNYLPEFAETSVAVANEGGEGYEVVPAKRPITIRDLLTHTSGIGYGAGVAKDRWDEAKISGWYFADRDEPIGDTVARMARLPFDAQPGEAWVYGYSSDILGALIERVSGQSLDAFLKDQLLSPLGMHDTHFYLPKDKQDRLSAVYSATDKGGLERAPAEGRVGQGAYVDGPRISYSGGAGLLSTATDYGRLLQMLLNGGELDGVRILSPKTVELMVADHVGHLLTGDDWRGLGMGLGFYVVKDIGATGAPGSVGEFGWGGAYHSTYWVDPEEQLVVVYLTQLIPAGDLDDQDKLRSLIYQAIVD